MLRQPPRSTPTDHPFPSPPLFRSILHRDGDAVRAWLNICPHAGRRLDWAPGQFLKSREGHLVCAVHGATFELSGGVCVAGPCRGESLRAVAVEVKGDDVRSEEHTSELQSLMRISYAVFCLKKKNNRTTTRNI